MGVVGYPDHLTIGCRDFDAGCFLIFSATTSTEKKFVFVDIANIANSTIDLTTTTSVYDFTVTADHTLTDVRIRKPGSPLQDVFISYTLKSYTWIDKLNV